MPAIALRQGRRAAPRAEIIEGYGITECSPVVSANRPGVNDGHRRQADARRRGLRRRPETDRPLPAGQRGMLLVSGPTVFPGYLDYEARRSWSARQALVRHRRPGGLDADGFIHFRGRLKRFLKAGGEMISLPALEEPFAHGVSAQRRRAPGGGRGNRDANGPPDRPVHHGDITLQEANALFVEAGFRGVMRLDEVRQMERIPVLGTGKVDYRQLRGLIAGPTRAAASP